jgi:hypothetical protein
MAKLVAGPKLSGSLDDITFYMLEGECVAKKKTPFNKRNYKKKDRYRGFKRSGQTMGSASRMLSQEVYRLLPREQRSKKLWNELCSRANRLLYREHKTLEEVKEIIKRELESYESKGSKGSKGSHESKGSKESYGSKGSKGSKESKGSYGEQAVSCEGQAASLQEREYQKVLEERVEHLEGMVGTLLERIEEMMKAVAAGTAEEIVKTKEEPVMVMENKTDAITEEKEADKGMIKLKVRKGVEINDEEAGAVITGRINKEEEKDINVGVVLNTIGNTIKEDWWTQKNKEKWEAVKWHWN